MNRSPTVLLILIALISHPSVFVNQAGGAAMPAASEEAAPSSTSTGTAEASPVPANGLSFGGHEMVFVKGGCFQMGDIFDDGGKDEKPVHEVCLNDFLIGKYEVTGGQWRHIMGDGDQPPEKGGNNYPIGNVSWSQVQDYIRKINLRYGGGFRLPTEAEWEYACRSGGKAQRYCGGDEVDPLAWYSANAPSSWGEAPTPLPVGTKSPNGLGLYDMSGNVAEWCSDFYKNLQYYFSAKDNPVLDSPPKQGWPTRVTRGGSVNDDKEMVRSMYRGFRDAADHSVYLGFRLVLPDGDGKLKK